MIKKIMMNRNMMMIKNISRKMEREKKIKKRR